MVMESSMRILLLRPEDQSIRTAAKLEALGHEAICSPLTKIVYCNPSPPLPGGDEIGLLATSARAFEGLAQTDPKWRKIFIDCPLFCVGEQTAQAANNGGFHNIALVAQDALELISLMRQQKPMPLVYLAGKDRQPILEQGLSAKGWQIAPWILYEAQAAQALTTQAQAALRRQQIDAVLHYSKRHAEIFIECIRDAGLENEIARLPHLCLSDSVAEALHPYVQLSLIASQPDEAGMLRRLGVGNEG